MQRELGGRGLKVVGATLEDSAASVQDYQKEVARFEYTILTGSGEAQTPLPTTYLIDREGRVRQRIIGARDRAGWEAAVTPLLDEAIPTAQK
jgi:hypothetical protein